MTTLQRVLQPWCFFTLIALLGIGVVVGGTLLARKVMHARDAEQRVCAAEIRALRARNPIVRTYWRPADDCLALSILATKETR